MPEPPPTFKIRLRIDRLNLAMRAAGILTNTALARRMSVSVTTVSRLRSGKDSPGARTMWALLEAFPDLTKEDLFERVEDEAVAHHQASVA
jgi:transcriptional regulator with XRE-family HTH domain